ncbi:4Fe-4S binding domain-containing protein [Dehalogenimonas formicexedens]|uniref:4Fe-4S binding domain-containing protein n=1 Tax=Dehalogenimonas formicexedens TaxID=1839801 RepID=A0A1P8F5R1_9CHLR|nr:YfhL family 4Fe-4S dicluster ferredoxin [Dehalogenimonas formicexedens]APV43826.1 4Fe-4S binding domain-containing protein [Dehalogenimonas formicexedens]
MAFKITDECISCGACEPECPNAAITEGENIYVIDPTKCTECVGSFATKQCAEICPVDCCVPDEAHVESREALLAKWRTLHPGKEPKL